MNTLKSSFVIAVRVAQRKTTRDTFQSTDRCDLYGGSGNKVQYVTSDIKQHKVICVIANLARSAQWVPEI